MPQYIESTNINYEIPKPKMKTAATNDDPVILRCVADVPQCIHQNIESSREQKNMFHFCLQYPNIQTIFDIDNPDSRQLECGRARGNASQCSIFTHLLIRVTAVPHMGHSCHLHCIYPDWCDTDTWSPPPPFGKNWDGGRELMTYWGIAIK